MIYESMQILMEQLGGYLTDIGHKTVIELRNIALWDYAKDDDTAMANKLIFTLVRLEEEVTLKNSPHTRIIDNKSEYRNPPVHLNLYVLVSANFKNYDTSLITISKSIEFFQGKNVFTSSNTVFNRDNVTSEFPDEFKFIMEIYSPSFEELNNIWGTLGGRQLPSVIYRVQLIRIESKRKLSESELISNIGGNLKDYK